jgi:alpha-tubulin suppressor-like RCC1 family protein
MDYRPAGSRYGRCKRSQRPKLIRTTRMRGFRQRPQTTGCVVAVVLLGVLASGCGGSKPPQQAAGLVNRDHSTNIYSAAIAAGSNHTCALVSTGQVECWGDETAGEIGNGTQGSTQGPTQTQNSPATVVQSGGEVWVSHATAVAVGRGNDNGLEGDHSCALVPTGGIDCWGDNQYGELGDGSTTNSSTPVPVAGISNATAVSSGDRQSCALLSTGQIECWGLLSSAPAPVQRITNATAIAITDTHSCALLSTKHVECWGEDGLGQLGNGLGEHLVGAAQMFVRYSPTEVPGISNATQVAVGGNSSCARLATGRIECWGSNYDGELGLGNGTATGPQTCGILAAKGPCSTKPAPVAGISSALSISLSANHSCAVLSSHGVDCWGFNKQGSLGIGTQAGSQTCPGGDPCSTTPTPVVGITSAVAVSAGDSYSCAILSSGLIKCWGYNNYGQLGDGSTTNSSTPVQATGISNSP